MRRRAERVSRPAREKNRRRSVLVVTICAPRPMRAVQRARLCVSKTIIPEAAEHFLTPSASRDTHIVGGLGLNAYKV